MGRRKQPCVLLNSEHKPIKSFASLAEARKYCNYANKIDNHPLKLLRSGHAIKLNNHFICLTKFKDSFIPAIGQLPKELRTEYLSRREIIINTHKRTVFVTDSNLNIINVYPGYNGIYPKIASDHDISTGCLKAYVHRSIKFYLSGKRKKFFFNRESYFMALKIKFIRTFPII